MKQHGIDLAGRRTLFVASTGGHLAQLHRLSREMNADEGSHWVTFESPQSQSLLRDASVTYVPYVAPRDARGTFEASRVIGRLLDELEIEAVVSTGAAIAIGAFVPARPRRIPTYYVESVSRVQGPSLTGRLTSTFRLARTYTQHAKWAGKKWTLHPSVLAAYSRVAADRPSGGSPLVTLGTIRPYRFDRIVDMVLDGGVATEETVWQLGVTDRRQLPGRSFELLSAEDFSTAARAANVVVTHAGVGTILGLLEMGIYPVVIPRESQFGEHVDDHQLQICDVVEKAKVGLVLRSGHVDETVIKEASSWRVTARG